MKIWFLLLIVGVSISRAAIFSLSDSDPNSAEFKKRFLASYGVNETIEPKLAARDQALYRKVLPLLSSAPRDAIAMVRAEVDAKSNAAFDFLIGNLSYQLRDFAAAERAMKEAIRKFPSFRRAYRSLALIYVQESEFDRAIEPLLRVIELGGGDAQSYGLLGYAYLVGEKYESGLAAYRMARMFKPDSLDFRRGQAQCLLQTHQNELAIALFDELIAEFPTESDFWLLQANAFLALGQQGQAIANLELVGDQEQGNGATFALLGDLYLSDDLPQLALAAYLRALELDPVSDQDRQIRPLKSLVARRYFDEGKRYLDAIRKTFRSGKTPIDQREIDLAEAKIEAELGDTERALSLLKKSLDSDPLNGEVLLSLGNLYLGNEAFDEAERHYELALSDPGTKADALVSLGRLAVARGRYTIAVNHLREAQEIRPEPNVARYLEAVERRSRTRE